jgi:type I restriction enzyme S subunit
MSTYKSYRPSGVEWIGEIPEHWITLSFTKIIKIRHGYQFREYDFTDSGIKIIKITQLDRDGFLNLENCSFIDSNRIDEFERILIYQDDILMCLTGGTIGKIIKVGEVNESLIQNYRVGHFSPLNNKILNDYIFWFMTSSLTTSQMFSEIRETGQPNIGMEDFGKMKVILPPISEQEQIVTYLDEKTTIIDKLISTKQRKVELLKEQRTTLINQVITNGLNPNVKMKDSGVEWIGEIPENWIVSKLKYDTTKPVQYGLNISGDNYKEEGIRFIRITDISENGELIEENGKYLEKINVPDEFLLNKFDVLFCRSGHTVGKSYLHLLEGEYTTGGYLVRFNFDNYSNSKFIFYLSKTNFYWDWIKLNSVVSTIENVNGDKYQNFIYPKPTNGEQEQIVEYLDKQTKEIDDLVYMEQNKIELLKEYRQSLISEVITGKIKVVE